MNILLDTEAFTFTGNNIPLLIHGEDGFGASLFTIATAAQLLKNGSKVLFLCGYHKAHEELLSQSGPMSERQLLLYTKEEQSQFMKKLEALSDDTEWVLVIKNIELFSEEFVEAVLKYQNIIISGNLNKCVFKEMLLNRVFENKILFSPLDNIQMPEVGKYKGYFISESHRGVVELSS